MISSWAENISEICDDATFQLSSKNMHGFLKWGLKILDTEWNEGTENSQMAQGL